MGHALSHQSVCHGLRSRGLIYSVPSSGLDIIRFEVFYIPRVFSISPSPESRKPYLAELIWTRL